jgi:hypothetical protein
VTAAPQAALKIAFQSIVPLPTSMVQLPPLG